MERWRTAWRKGVAPLLSTKGLEALRVALVEDDRRLEQGVTTSPPAMQGALDWPVEQACGLVFPGWQADGLATVAEAQEYFGQLCHAIDQRLGAPAGCCWFLNWFDDTPREEMRRELLTEVLRTLAERAEAACS